MKEQEYISINEFLVKLLNSHNILVLREKNGWIEFPRIKDAPFYAYQTRQPKIRGAIVCTNQHPQNVVVQLDIQLQLTDGHVLCESFAGIGIDENSAIENGIQYFLTNSFHVLTSAFYFQKNDQVMNESWEINGSKWHVFTGNVVGRSSDSETNLEMPVDIQPTMANLIKSLNLNGNCHWIRLFYANFENGTVQSEVLLNNEVWQEASDKIGKCDWAKRAEYYTFRNFIVLVNEEYYASKSFVLDERNRKTFSDRLIAIQLQNLVATSVELFRNNAKLEESELLKIFVENGIPLSISKRLIEFLPIAYGRVLLQDVKVKLSDYFERLNSKSARPTVIARKKLAENPIYAMAHNFAENEVNYDYEKDDFLAIAFRSAEVQAINDLLNQGSKPDNIVTTALCLTWDDDLVSDFYAVSNTPRDENAVEKSWWQIWK